MTSNQAFGPFVTEDHIPLPERDRTAILVAHRSNKQIGACLLDHPEHSKHRIARWLDSMQADSDVRITPFPTLADYMAWWKKR